MTQEQLQWFADRIQRPLGTCQVRKYVRDKYRKLTGDYQSPDYKIRAEIIRIGNSIWNHEKYTPMK